MTLVVNNLSASAGDAGDALGSISGLVDLLEKGMVAFYENPNGQKSRVACSPWGHKESNMTEVT